MKQDRGGDVLHVVRRDKVATREMATETSSPEDHAILDLVASYEEERYGLRPASEDTVNQLKKILRQQHFGKG